MDHGHRVRYFFLKTLKSHLTGRFFIHRVETSIEDPSVASRRRFPYDEATKVRRGDERRDIQL